jgi:hypothetical protein
MNDSGKTFNEPLIVVAKSNEGIDIMKLLRYWPLFHGADFSWVLFQMFRGYQL